jgi:spore germination protein
MEIYVVQQGDTIYSISDKYGVTVDKLAQDNGLVAPFNLVIGQAIVIAFPKQSYTVQQGDTLQSIADAFGVSVMQLLRNNPFLFDREYIYPGETLVISYNTNGSITTNGFAYPYVKKDTLLKILPNLTYISVFNYSVSRTGDIITYYDDIEIIKKSKEFSVIPLMVLSTLTPQGEPNYDAELRILLNEESQDNLINNFITTMENKGYFGVNIIFNYLNEDDQLLYLNFTKKISNRVQQEGFQFFLTINYNIQEIDNKIEFEKVNYSEFAKYVDGLIFLEFVWGTNNRPPEPVCNMYHIGILVDYLISSNVPRNKIVMGKPIIGYDWKLPFIPDVTNASSLSLYSAFDIAYNYGAIIEFDENSQTPYYYYNELLIAAPSQHIVWFLDARSINSLDKLIADTELNGGGVWNIMIYYPQLWIIIYSQYNIIKLYDYK